MTSTVKHQFINRASNATTVGTKNVHVTFWKRAAAACGMIEAYRGMNCFHAHVTLYGWMVSFEILNLKDHSGHTTYIHRYLKWGDYSRNYGSTFVDRALASFMGWVFSKQAVQKAVVREISCSTPIGRMLNDHIQSSVEESRNDVDADDVHGLDSAIENCVESAIDDFRRNGIEDAIDMDNISEKVMEAIANDSEFQAELTRAVVEEITSRLK